MTGSRKQKRQNGILSALDNNPTLRVSELAEDLNVSTETIRRDLAELDKAGRISRTYGGAVRSQMSEPHLNERINHFPRERQAIAHLALEMVQDCNAIFIGGGATTLHFARLLRHTDQPLSVITPAFHIARELSENPRLQVMCLPGIFDGSEGLVTGGETLAAIEKFRTPVAVMGASGIDESGISEAMLNAAEIYAAIIAASDKTYILADHSKFSHRALRLISRWNEGIHLVTNTRPAKDLAGVIEQQGGTIHDAGDYAPYQLSR